jgi:tetratricopeptide (TPR) repeat protein
MRRKREAPAKPDRRPQPPAADSYQRLDDWLLGGVVALLVATPLVPSESTVHEGSAAALNLLWMLVLFAWAALVVLRPDPQIKFGWTGVAAAALVGWHTLSALTAGMAGNGRQALNMLWQMICYACAAFLLRQLLKSPAQCRALVAILIAVAALESAQGYYEYFVSKPALLAEFEKNPEKAYAEQGVTTQSQREHLRWRIESVEPLGTFALANSLAGLLAPWLVALLGIALTTFESRGDKRLLIGTLVVAAAIAGCLLLTKSRTAILAVGVGIALLALYGRSSGWRIGWKLPVAAALVVVLLGLGVVAVGGLDVQVLSEAPTSVLYRLQYWQSTSAIIADDPLLGCGPGQFQESYARYKLPQASETPRDPHNFLLEIWSTAGTPALVALLAMAIAFACQLASSRPVIAADAGQSADRDFVPRLMLYAAGVFGLALGYAAAFVAGYPPPLGIWFAGLPATAVTLGMLDTWVASGRLPVSIPIIAIIVLLVNLLAAGATSFPGVFLTAWILVPLTLAQMDAPAWAWRPSRLVSLAVLVATLVLAIACMRTELSPILTVPNRLAAAEQYSAVGKIVAARHELQLATTDDPWSPQPLRHLAYLELNVWTETRWLEDWNRFVAASQAYRARDPRHHLQHSDRGNWFLLAWRTSGDSAHLEDAIEAYQEAIVWYPAQALARAQLAWALHLGGRDAEAIAAAQEATHLDSLHIHRELKLLNQMVYDPQPEALMFHRNAEQALEQVLAQVRTSVQPED